MPLPKKITKTEEDIASTKLGNMRVKLIGTKCKFTINIDIYNKAADSKKITISCRNRWIKRDGDLVCIENSKTSSC